MKSFFTLLLVATSCLVATEDKPSLAEVNDEITDVQDQIAIYKRKAYFAGDAAGRLMSLDYFGARQRALQQEQYLAIVSALQERLKTLQDEREKLLQEENGKVNSAKTGGD